MTLEERLKEKREAILRICAKHGARNVRVFGSVAAVRPMSKATSISSSNSIPNQACSTTPPCGSNCRIYSGVSWTW